MMIPSLASFAMIGLPEMFIVLLVLGGGLTLVGALLGLVLRSHATSTQTRKRLDQSECEVLTGPVPPRIDH